MSLRRVIDALTDLGVDADTSASDAKYIILTNFLALLACFVSLIYLAVNSTLGDDIRVQLGPPLVSAFVYAVPLWLNHRRRYWHATTFLCLATLALQLSFVFAFGYASGNHFFMLPLLGGVPLIYPPRHRRTVAALMVVVIGVFSGIVLAGTNIRPLVDLDASAPAVYNTLALILVPMIIAFVSYYSHRRMTIAESRLEARSRELADALAELKLAQAQMIETANQVVLARLMAGLLHEVNTPLGSIRSAADTLRAALERCRTFIAESAEGDDADREKVLRALDVSADVGEALDVATTRITSVVEGLRRFVALDEAEHKLFDVRETIDGVLAVLAPSFGDRIDVVRSYPDSVPSVLGSPAKLNGALLSVLQNSVQAIELRGEIRIIVSASNDGVEVELTDDGRGIPSHVVSEIFEISLTQKEGRVGMRLGLPMSKRSVEQMGGRIRIASVEGRGTTVRMTLPATERP